MSPQNQKQRETTSNSPLLIGDLLAAGINRGANREIVDAGGYRQTYITLQDRITRLASALTAVGVSRGKTVAVMEWDSHRYLECYFAIPMLGAVLHTVNIRLSAEQLLYTINHAADDLIISNACFLATLTEILPRIEKPFKLVIINEPDQDRINTLDDTDSLGDYEDLLTNADPHFQFPELTDELRATTFYTTGTTGLPKGVYFSHRQLVLHTLSVSTALLGEGQGHITQNDIYMPLTPMFHVHAWGMPYLATSLGLKQVYPGHYRPSIILKLIQTEGVTFSHCVPTVLQMVITAPEAKHVRLDRWIIVIGGAALSRALTDQARALGIDIFGGYGMSETCPVLTLSQLNSEMLALDNEQQLEARRLAGRPIPLVAIRVVDEHMHDVPRDDSTQGEIVVRAPWLTEGYLRDDQNTAQLWRGGWMHTGDIGYINTHGYLRITDRIKDVIKSGGEWISSLDIEDMLVRHPEVKEAAVFAIPDEKWGERPVALIVLEEGATIKTEALVAYLKSFSDRGLLSRYGILSKLQFVDKLPKTSVGKLDKKVMREMYARPSSSTKHKQ